MPIFEQNYLLKSFVAGKGLEYAGRAYCSTQNTKLRTSLLYNKFVMHYLDYIKNKFCTVVFYSGPFCT